MHHYIERWRLVNVVYVPTRVCRLSPVLFVVDVKTTWAVGVLEVDFASSSLRIPLRRTWNLSFFAFRDKNLTCTCAHTGEGVTAYVCDRSNPRLGRSRRRSNKKAAVQNRRLPRPRPCVQHLATQHRRCHHSGWLMTLQRQERPGAFEVAVISTASVFRCRVSHLPAAAACARWQMMMMSFIHALNIN